MGQLRTETGPDGVVSIAAIHNVLVSQQQGGGRGQLVRGAGGPLALPGKAPVAFMNPMTSLGGLGRDPGGAQTRERP
jgi:hypothetical protein